MFDSVPFLILTKTVTLTLAGVITYLGIRASMRQRSTALRAMALGFGLITLGAAVGGVLHQFVGLSFGASQNVQSLFTACGFLVLTVSLYVGESSKTVVKASLSHE